MPTEPKLENYLTALDRALKPLPVSERADILIEIKSHVLSALEREPQQPMDAILSALGEPETVANRYLLERGKSPVKPPISPIVKWLVIGFLGTVAMVLLFAGLLIVKFAPSLSFDKDSFSIGTNIEKEESYTFKPGEARPLAIRAKNAKMELRTSDTSDLIWNCKSSGKNPKIEEREKEIALDFGAGSSVKCVVDIPEKTHVLLDVGNAKVVLEKPRFHLDAKIGNGKVTIRPEPGQKYNYDISAVNGKMDAFQSSNDPDAYKIIMRLINGKISREEQEQ